MKLSQDLRRATDTLHMDGAWKTCVETFVFDCRVRRLSPRTIGAYIDRLAALGGWLAGDGTAFAAVDRNVMRRYVAELVGTVADETLAGHLRCYRRLWNFLIAEGLRDAPNPLDGVRIRCERKVRRTLPPEALDLVLSACDKRTFVGFRNYVMVLTMYDTMVRRAEVQKMTVGDVDLASYTLRVQGKGRCERLVPLSDKTARALHRWLATKRGDAPGDALFCTRRGRPLSYMHVHQVLKRLGRKVGVKASPHLLRHSGATQFLRNGGSLAVLSRVLGHAALSTTAIYVHLDIGDAIKSYERFSPAGSLRA